MLRTAALKRDVPTSSLVQWAAIVASAGTLYRPESFFAGADTIQRVHALARSWRARHGHEPQKRGPLMPFTLTQWDGTLVLGSPDGSVLAPEVDELNKVCERIEQEKTYTNRAESEVSSIAEQVKTDALSVPDGLKQALAVEQNLETNMKKIKKRPFTVYAIDEHGKPIEHPDPSHPDPSVKVFDILIHTEDLNVPEERADFKVEVDRTVTVVDVVLKTEANGLWRFLPWTPSSLQRKKERRAEYMAGLRGICYVGLAHEDPSQLKLASKSLTTFREDFVAKEAGMVKNTYLSRLGVACLLMAVFSSLAYVYARSLPEGHVVHDFRN